jgi:hypothetical protein
MIASTQPAVLPINIAVKIVSTQPAVLPMNIMYQDSQYPANSVTNEHYKSR